MQHCGRHYGVYNGSTWIWYTDYKQAATAEHEVWASKVRAKLAEGKRVILTAEMAEALGIGLDPKSQDAR